MAIRIDEGVTAASSLYSPQPEPDMGQDVLDNQQADPQTEPYGLSIYHDGSDVNKGSGIRL